jgi:hypothetical protein
MDPSKDYADIARGIEGFLNLQPLLNSIQEILNDYFPAAYLIAFVLLVVGTMREFLFPETRRFMQNLLRAVLLVAAISFLPSFMNWCDQAFKALAELPAAQIIAFGDSRYAIKAGGDGSNVTTIEQVLESKIAISNVGTAGSATNGSSTKGAPQLSGNPLDIGKNVETVWNYIVGRGVNLVWQILFAIYLLCLLLCKFIIVLMQFLQKVTIMGFKLYAPIGVAEYAHHSLKSKSTAFFLTFAGVMTWPVGWSIVNAVTLGVLKSVPGPQDQNFATLIVAIVLAIPVLLWVVIGHVVAPVYMQKVVMRGGGVVQGFVGTMYSAVGAGSMAAYAAVSRDLAEGLRNNRQVREDGRGTKVSRAPFQGKGFEGFDLAEEHLCWSEAGEKRGKHSRSAGQASGGREASAGRLPDVGAGVLDAGAGLMGRLGTAARFVGHAIAEGGGDRAGLDYRALATFAPRTANLGSSTYRPNRSSLQARKYLSEE